MVVSTAPTSRNSAGPMRSRRSGITGLLTTWSSMEMVLTVPAGSPPWTAASDSEMAVGAPLSTSMGWVASSSPRRTSRTICPAA